MTEFRFDMQPAINQAKEKAIREIENTISRAGSNVASDVMSNGRYGKEGLGHEILRKKIEDYVLSDKFAEKLDVIIEQVCEEQMISAAKVLIHSKTRKHLFESTVPQDG